jgi:hypothetical protein
MPARASRRHVDWRARLRNTAGHCMQCAPGMSAQAELFHGDGRPRELAAYGPVVATDDRSKLYARTVTVHGNIQRTSPSACKGGVQRTAGSDGNRCFVDTCKHVPQANSQTDLRGPPHISACCWPKSGRSMGLLTVSQVHETSLRDVQ